MAKEATKDKAKGQKASAAEEATPPGYPFWKRSFWTKKKGYVACGVGAIVVGGIAWLLLAAEEEKTYDERAEERKVIVLEIEDPDLVIPGGVYKPDPFVVNLAGNSGILRATIVLEFYDFSPPSISDHFKAVIRDRFIHIASSYEANRLLQETKRQELKNRLISELEDVLPAENPATKVYFEDFNVQPSS